MKRTLTLLTTSLLAALAALPAQAQSLGTAPAPGLWESEGRMTVNGQDLGALMRQSMEAALKDMPADQRAMAEQMMKAQGAAFGGKEQDCLTPTEAARRTDPRAVLADLQKDSPQCRYEAVQVSGSTLSFKGRCNDPDGFSGDITGEFTMNGPKAYTGRWGGTGRMANAEQIPGLKVAGDGRVQFGWTGSGRWLAASCGAVKPQ
jgi:hypothetical protein